MNLHGLDGLDFDWEYPASPDLPGSEVIEGQYYLDFLTAVKALMTGTKTLSFAAPASYWYLRGFPVGEMAEVVDYIIYMTYDLHGQWDWGSPWSQEGCPAGNCLRSHVNMTTTMNTLTMITKAGVPAWKVIVGITSYGRVFKMTNSNCLYQDYCTYTGPASGVLPGRCTNEAGYLAQAEIDEIVAQNPNTISWTDTGGTASAYMVYNDTEWVAFMNDAQKAARTELYRDLNFGGTTDWAVDLQSFEQDNNWSSVVTYTSLMSSATGPGASATSAVPPTGASGTSAGPPGGSATTGGSPGGPTTSAGSPGGPATSGGSPGGPATSTGSPGGSATSALQSTAASTSAASTPGPTTQSIA